MNGSLGLVARNRNPKAYGALRTPYAARIFQDGSVYLNLFAIQALDAALEGWIVYSHVHTDAVRIELSLHLYLCTWLELDLLGIATELTGFTLWQRRNILLLLNRKGVCFSGVRGYVVARKIRIFLRVLGEKNCWKSDLRKFVGVSISMRKVSRGLAKGTRRVMDDQRTVQIWSVLRELEQFTHRNSFSLQPGMGIITLTSLLGRPMD